MRRETNISKSRVIWAEPCENVSSGICKQQKPRSACTSLQSDQGLHYLLTESLDITECMNGEGKPRQYFAHVLDNLCIYDVGRHYFT